MIMVTLVEGRERREEKVKRRGEERRGVLLLDDKATGGYFLGLVERWERELRTSWVIISSSSFV